MITVMVTSYFLLTEIKHSKQTNNRVYETLAINITTRAIFQCLSMC